MARIHQISAFLSVGALLVMYQLYSVYEEQVTEITNHLYQKISAIANDSVLGLNELLEPEQFVEIEPQECLPLAEFDGGIKTEMCIKPVETDIWVSGAIKAYGSFEYTYVNNVVKAMAKFENATFLDVGSNIGMYTVVVAAMKRQVVAVDADPVNLAYVRRSLDLTSHTEYVRIVYNSVSNEHMTLYPFRDDPSNQGRTMMKTAKQMEEHNLIGSSPPIHSVTMLEIFTLIQADTIILKIDIEGYECKALQSEILLSLSGKFIPYIFMEFGFIKLPENENNCPEYKEWVELFFLGGYMPANPATLEIMEKESIDVMWDLVWVHSSVK